MSVEVIVTTVVAILLAVGELELLRRIRDLDGLHQAEVERHNKTIEEHNEIIRLHSDAIERIQSDLSADIKRMADHFTGQLREREDREVTDSVGISDTVEAELRPQQPPPVYPEWVPTDGGHRLRITNEGATLIELAAITVLEDPSLLVPPVLPPEALPLPAGRHHEVIAAPSLATPPFVTVRISWFGPDGFDQSDFQVSTI